MRNSSAALAAPSIPVGPTAEQVTEKREPFTAPLSEVTTAACDGCKQKFH